MKIIEVVNALERFAPLPLQEDYDNAGLQVGLTAADVSGALLCLDVTEQVVDEAVANGCNLIVSHHPLIFHRLSCISDADYVQRTVMKAIEHKVAIVSMHTNLDAAEGGVNFKIAEKLGLCDVRFIGKTQTATAPQPLGAATTDTTTEVRGGEGVIGRFAEPMAADDFLLLVKQRFDVECVMANELLRRPIATVVLCGGAGDFLLPVAVKAGADAFLTGEMHYHQYFGYEQRVQIAVIGHYQSEQYTKEILRDIIQRDCPGVRCVMSAINTNPILYI
ncbi:MAG: Nif3-like dinuclear metal center hexameric protein [Prevotella sp.]|nr:Nif3-like dinuclear metal center hexameric protein [Prevotella sp.]